MDTYVDPKSGSGKLKENELAVRNRLRHKLFSKNLNQMPVGFSKDPKIIGLVKKKKFQIPYDQIINLELIANTQVYVNNNKFASIPEITYSQMKQHGSELFHEVDIKTKKALVPQSTV